MVLPLLIAMFLAINMGGSGTSPSFSSAYGADLIRKDLIPGLFGIFVFGGAILAGEKVALTLGRDILPDACMTTPLVTVILLSVALSLLAANLLRVPQSTSQATVCALVGAAVFFRALKSERLLLEIIPTWFILPIASFVLTLALARLLLRSRSESASVSPSGGRIRRWLVIGGACYVAFAIGSNNVANATGPVAVLIAKRFGTAAGEEPFGLVILLATLIVAPCFGIGSSLLGGRVVDTTGKQIVDFGARGAAIVSTVTATLLLLASVTRGIPTSLVQMNTAAILALGVCKQGWRATWTRSSVRRLLAVWIVAPLLSLCLSFGLCIVAERLGLLTV